MNLPVGEEGEEISKDQSALEMVAYRDTWGRGTDSYLAMMYERLSLMRELLTDDGSIFVHIDWHVQPMIWLILNEIFGKENFHNDIVWGYHRFGVKAQKQFTRAHDTILWFSKTNKWTFNLDEVRIPYSEKTKANFVEGLSGSGFGAGQLNEEGKIPEDYWIIAPAYKSLNEVLPYPTQKPRTLLERIIKAASNKDDIIADFFCGSGTTLDAAEKLGRRWIGADLGRFAIHTTRKRMIEVQRERHQNNEPYRPFDVFNLGRYERQWWQKERLQGADEEHRKVVLGFYKAEPLTQSPSPLLHGRKGRAFCHVDGIDSLLTREELENVAEACHNAGGKELHCLAWEFEMNLKEIALRLEKEYGLDSIRLIPIPREIMEKNRKEPPPFLEVAELEAEPVVHKDGNQVSVDIKLTKFLPSLAEVPSKELEALRERAIQSGFDFIDFWAIDFDYHSDQPFYHHWQTYRTRKNRKLPTVSDKGFEYAVPGKHTICIKVIDVFGCDTTTLMEVNV